MEYRAVWTVQERLHDAEQSVRAHQKRVTANQHYLGEQALIQEALNRTISTPIENHGSSYSTYAYNDGVHDFIPVDGREAVSSRITSPHVHTDVSRQSSYNDGLHDFIRMYSTSSPTSRMCSPKIYSPRTRSSPIRLPSVEHEKADAGLNLYICQKNS